MTLILSGTDGLSDVDGSAATPAIRGTDANTGIFFPAADTIAFSEGGVESMRIDSSGNVGIGRSPNYQLDVYRSGTTNTTIASANDSVVNILQVSGNTAGVIGTITSHPLVFTAGNTERMRIDSSGNVGIGTASPGGARLRVEQPSSFYGNTYPNQSWAYASKQIVNLQMDGSVNPIFNTDPESYWSPAATMIWQYRGSEKARIDSSGNLLVGTTDTAVSSGVGVKFLASATGPYMGYVVNTASNLNTYHFFNTNATNNGFRFYVNVNGGIYNFSGNNSNLSDERKKTNIELSGNYLDKICAIPVKLFNYKDEPTGEQRTLGVIAQDVEAVAPELVNNEGFGETPEGEAPLKSVYTTDMMFALMKCIQEQQAIITQLQADVAALKAPQGTP